MWPTNTEIKTILYQINILSNIHFNKTPLISQKQQHRYLQLKCVCWHTYRHMEMWFRRSVCELNKQHTVNVWVFPPDTQSGEWEENMPFFVFVVSCKSLLFCDWSVHTSWTRRIQDAQISHCREWSAPVIVCISYFSKIFTCKLLSIILFNYCINFHVQKIKHKNKWKYMVVL